MAELWAEGGQSYGQGSVRRPQRHLRQVFNRLIIMVFSFVCMVFPCKGQRSSQLAYEQAVCRFFEKQMMKFGGVDGIATPTIISCLNPDSSTSSNSVLLGNPSVSYVPLRGHGFIRNISFQIQIVSDSMVISEYDMTVTDTLSKSEIKVLRKNENPEFRGPDPRWTHRFLFPLIGVSAGLGVILSLYFIRSH